MMPVIGVFCTLKNEKACVLLADLLSDLRMVDLDFDLHVK